MLGDVVELLPVLLELFLLQLSFFVLLTLLVVAQFFVLNQRVVVQ